MLIPIKVLKDTFNVSPVSILHVGAHKAEELNDYTKFWAPFKQPIYWVEGQPLLAEELRNRSDLANHVIVEAFVWNEDNVKLDFNLASNSQSSSLLQFGTHQMKIPDIKFTKTITALTRRLESILPEDIDFDFINLDLQGVELQALQGMGPRLNSAKWIYTEVNREEVYINCTNILDLDLYLKTFGFRRIATRWVQRQGWGDALYIKNPKIHLKYLAKWSFTVREIFRNILIMIRNNRESKKS